MDPPTPALKVIQVLVAALLGGLVFATIVMSVVPGRGGAADPMMLNILLAAGGSILVAGQIAAVVIRRVHVAHASRSAKDETDDAGRAAACLPHFQVATILQAALAEGPGLLGAVTFMLTGSRYGLVIAGAAAATLIVMFPTAGRFNRFVEDATGVRAR